MPTTPEYGVDLITFYDPSFWGVNSYDEIMEIRHKNPVQIWTTIFDALSEAGITAIEMTFPPADVSSALDAFGSAEGFKTELQRRGLKLKSSFHMGSGWGPGGDRNAEVAKAVEHATFLAEAGGDTLVVGPPMRKSRDANPPLFIDHAFASAVADTAHAVGNATLRLGVKTALHTEAHSMFCTRRDIDLLLGLTDPEYVFFCPDTAHITLAGGNPIDAVVAHSERVVIAHWKDAVGPMPAGLPIEGEKIHELHQGYMCTLGEGVVDWDRWITLYDKTQGSDVRLLELDAVADPIKEMKAAKAFVENASAQNAASGSSPGQASQAHEKRS
ncbi:sugar phosphate isomerase/epimerase [Saxibacter everestensis]|uniref:Sugar phosphate isomerase/epimerase n=1 Tax=Saxibacter everestensis TaxID=2909229 RepID=A0ABY8QX76_9MICO|nr:sugar phosphate isomerase/epimerase [Brevibacteriaceae bacterium ZFBP1038]